MSKAVRFALLLLGLTLPALSSCSASTECATAQDCFLGEVCQSGRCLEEVHGTGPEQDAHLSPQKDATVAPDGSPESPDIVEEETGPCVDRSLQACGPRVTEAPHTVGNQRSEAVFSLAPSMGCVNDANVLREYDKEDPLHPGRICPSESVDWYTFTLLACESQTYVAEFRIVVDACPLEMVVAGLTSFSQELSCDDDNLSCTTEDDAIVLRLKIPPTQRHVANRVIYLFVGTEVESGTFDYDLHYRVYGI